MPVMSPPVLKEIQRGKALAKSFAGETTLAAMLTASVATTTVNIETATTHTCENCPTSFIGSQSCAFWSAGRPEYIANAAEVIMTLIAAKTVMVVGSAIVWPMTCSRWLRPKRVKSGMFRESVAQKPTIAVREGTKTGRKSDSVWNFPGALKSGPTPPACRSAHTSSIAVITSTKGAAQFSTFRRRFIPR